MSAGEAAEAALLMVLLGKLCDTAWQRGLWYSAAAVMALNAIGAWR